MTGRKIKIVTSALPYVNNVPHLGNIVGSVLSADVYARYQRCRGVEVVYVCGTDEYGSAIAIEAHRQQRTPREVADENYRRHRAIYEHLGISFDVFGRTTDADHAETVLGFFGRVREKHVVRRPLCEHVCPKCAIALPDRYITGLCGNCGSATKGDQCDGCTRVVDVAQLQSPRCALCGTRPETRTEDHLFFALDVLQRDVQTRIAGAVPAWSAVARAISDGLFAQGIRERCITRSMEWGIRVPEDAVSGKVFYVWFDALLGYVTLFRRWAQKRALDWQTVWNAPDTELVMFMGKDNVFFHSVVFPALLYAYREDMRVPDRIFATNYLLFEQAKFSKSERRGIFCADLLSGGDIGGDPDEWRHYLMMVRPETADTSYSAGEYAQIYRLLKEKIGNLVHRAVSYVRRRCSFGVLAEKTAMSEMARAISEADVLVSRYNENMENGCLKQALSRDVYDLAALGNVVMQEIFENAALSADEKAGRALVAVNIAAVVARLLVPYMPAAAAKMCAQMHVEPEKRSTIPDSFEFCVDEVLLAADENTPSPVFPQLPTAKLPETREQEVHRK